MIITKQWLNEWIDLSGIDTHRICEVLNSIGLEVDSVKKYRMPEGVVVGLVEEKIAHPNAEKLSICKVNVGSNMEQIVCGAKNVAKGQHIALATVGAVLPDGLKIKPAKLRGESSNGMICSSSELGLPKTNDGIMVLDESIGELKLGKNLSEYELLNDDVIEIELTANRGDCLSIHGVARDLSIALNRKLKKLLEFEEGENLLGIGRVLSLHADENLNSSVAYKAFEHNEINSNILIDLRLKIAQVEAQSALEKLINYASYSTGVLFRAYDLECFQGEKKAQIVVKKDEDGFDCVYGNGISVCKIGFNQEKKCELKKDIVIEASYIEPDFISLQGMKYKKMTRDFHYYNSSRGSEPNLTFGMKYLNLLFDRYTDVKFYGGEQSAIREKEAKFVNVSLNQVSSIIGQEIDKNSIFDILKGLGFEPSISGDQDLMSVLVPPFRHDICGKQDICEEIVRIQGIDNIKSKPYIYAEKLRINDAYVSYKKRRDLRLRSVANGFFESVHYVFDDSQKLKKYGFNDISEDRQITNPITNELNTLRQTLVLHLLDAVSLNTKNNKRKISLFEIGKAFDENRAESTKMTWVFSGEVESANVFNHGKPKIVDLKYFAKTMGAIIGEFELKKGECEKSLYSPYEFADIFINDVKIGFLARVHAKVESELNILPTYVCEIDFDSLPNGQKIAKPYAKFPTSSRDLSLLVDKKIEYKEIKKCIENLGLNRLVNFYAVDRFESQELGQNVSLSVTFVFQDSQKTLEDEEVNSMIEQILGSLDENLGIKLR